MPTGCTAAIADDISFEKFVWNCARAFGALVMLRDDQNAPIPEKFEPSTCYSQWADEARAQIAALEALSGDELAIAVSGAHEAATAEWRKRETEKDALRNKYNAMLAQVVQWEPPTSEHQGLKTFMVEQIRQSIDWDCAPTPAPTNLDPATWKASHLEFHRRALARHEQSQVDEIERAKERAEWVKALRESLPQPGVN